MKFITDESVEKPVVDALWENKYKVYYILEKNPGISDIDVRKLAYDEKFVLITADKDSSNLVFRQKGKLHGVILTRLAGLKNMEKTRIIINTFQKFAGEFENHFTVISKTLIRIVKS